MEENHKFFWNVCIEKAETSQKRSQVCIYETLLFFGANKLFSDINVVGMSIEKMWRNDEMTKFWNIM